MNVVFIIHFVLQQQHQIYVIHLMHHHQNVVLLHQLLNQHQNQQQNQQLMNQQLNQHIVVQKYLIALLRACNVDTTICTAQWPGSHGTGRA